jgi:hypothetical protein
VNHAGIGFPNGPVDNATVFSLPSPDLLMLSPEGRWHHDEAVRAGKRVLWRAIPRIGKRPAELGWSPARFVAETINLTDAPTLPIADFIPWNELDLRDERGDAEDDYAGLERRYALIGGWGVSVVQMLKQWSRQTRIHWPAFTPDHRALDFGHLWQPAADLADVVDFHAYDSLANIADKYSAYRSAFPSKPLALTEWHCKGDLDEERRVLAWLAETMAADPLFEAAYFFIYRWHNAPGWWSDAWDIEHSLDRLALFRNPPTVPLNPPAPQPPVVTPPTPEPPPEPVPMPDLTDEPDHLFTFEELWPTISAAGAELGFDAQVLAGIIEQESGFRNWRVHRDGTGHGLLGLDDNGLLPDFERWSGLSIGRGQAAASIPIVPQIRYAAHALADYAGRLGGPYAAARAWHRGEGLMDDAAGQHYEQLIRAHVAELFGGGAAPAPAPAARVTYNRDLPAIAQNDPWSCAPTSTRWALRAVGRHPAEGWMESQMVADGVVSEADGLLDATGDHLSAWIASEYGEFGYSANAESPVSFDALAAEFMAPSNPYPGLLGGRAWGHWSGLRSYDPATDQLQLANPADGWMFVSQTMSREQFAALGPFSLVRILHPDLLGAPAPTPPPPPPAPEPVPATPRRDDAIRAQIAAIRAACDQIEAALP